MTGKPLDYSQLTSKQRQAVRLAVGGTIDTDQIAGATGAALVRSGWFVRVQPAGGYYAMAYSLTQAGREAYAAAEPAGVPAAANAPVLCLNCGKPANRGDFALCWDCEYDFRSAASDEPPPAPEADDTLYYEDEIVDSEATEANKIMRLEAQLAASQEREWAAIEELKSIRQGLITYPLLDVLDDALHEVDDEDELRPGWHVLVSALFRSAAMIERAASDFVAGGDIDLNSAREAGIDRSSSDGIHRGQNQEADDGR